jgi:hypothetical protein
VECDSGTVLQSDRSGSSGRGSINGDGASFGYCDGGSASGSTLSGIGCARGSVVIVARVLVSRRGAVRVVGG